MTGITFWSKFVTRILARPLRQKFMLLTVVLSACAAQPPPQARLVDHAFGFDARVDSKDTEVLAYRYGVGDTPQTREPFWKDQLVSAQFGNINGPMPVGETLYVKWRTKSTNEVYEDLVNLRPLLPVNMHRQRIHFVAQGPRLYVYWVEPVPRPTDWPVTGPRKFQYEKVHQIYPATNQRP